MVEFLNKYKTEGIRRSFIDFFGNRLVYAENLDELSSVQLYIIASGAAARKEPRRRRMMLEKIIARNTGHDIGTFYDIIPLERGVSGRLMLIEILGSRMNLKLKKEINIRRALSPTMLESSCFIVDIQQDEEGLPVEITLSGAGWGHGSGMCQVGAASLGLQGRTYREILAHYYPASTVAHCYSLPAPTYSSE